MNDEQLVNLVHTLGQLKEFRTWRDEVAKPIIHQLEADLRNANEYPEVILRAKLMHLNMVKDLFYTLFEQVDSQIEKD